MLSTGLALFETVSERASVHRVSSNGLGLFTIDMDLVNRLHIEFIRMFLEHSGLSVIDNNRGKRHPQSEYIVIDGGREYFCDDVTLRQLAEDRHREFPFVTNVYFKTKKHWREARTLPVDVWRYPIKDWSLHLVTVFNLRGLKCLVSNQRTTLYEGFHDGVASLREEIGPEGIYLGLCGAGGRLVSLVDTLWVNKKDLTPLPFRDRMKVTELIAERSGLPVPERDDSVGKDFIGIDPELPYWKTSGHYIVSSLTTPKVVMNKVKVPALFDTEGNLVPLKRGWGRKTGYDTVIWFAEVLVRKSYPTRIKEVLHREVFDPLPQAKYANQYEYKRRLMKDGEVTGRAKAEINDRVAKGGT